MCEPKRRVDPDEEVLRVSWRTVVKALKIVVGAPLMLGLWWTVFCNNFTVIDMGLVWNLALSQGGETYLTENPVVLAFQMTYILGPALLVPLGYLSYLSYRLLRWVEK